MKMTIFRVLLILSALISFPIILSGNSMTQPVVVSEISTEIDGSTKRSALLRKIDLFEGMRFDSLESLAEYMDSAVQDLVNMRVFEEVDYSIEKKDAQSESWEYKVSLHIKDSITFYPIPYPKYNSNTGGRLGLHLYYYNMFGTLIDGDLSGNIDIIKDEESGRITIPGWHITPLIEGIPIGNMDIDLKYSHKFITDSPRGDLVLPSEVILENTIIKKDSYHNDSVSAGTEISISDDFYYRMAPEIGFNYAVTGFKADQATGELVPYEATPGENPDLDIMYFNWNHSLGYDSVDWIGNFRNGFAAELKNTLTLSTDFLREAPLHFSSSIEGEVKYFWRINKHFDLSALAGAMISFNRRMEDLGSKIRGVRDEQLFGDKALFFSLDLSILAIDWDGIGELLIIPYFNLGYVRNDMIRDYEMNFAEKDSFVYGTGLDIVLYIDKLNALTLRGTVGIDLGQYNWDSGDKWEIDIDTSLSY